MNFGIKPNLHDSCNISFWNELRFANEPQPSCSQDCGRIVCLDNYHDDGSQCGRFYKFILKLQKKNTNLIIFSTKYFR